MSTLKTVVALLVVGIAFSAIQAEAQSWTPPGGNVPGPLTTGTGSQTKSGGDISLSGGGSLYAGGLVAAPKLCIGADCRTAWPGGYTNLIGRTISCSGGSPVTACEGNASLTASVSIGVNGVPTLRVQGRTVTGESIVEIQAACNNKKTVWTASVSPLGLTATGSGRDDGGFVSCFAPF